MFSVLIQKFSQRKHYPHTALLGGKTVHDLYPSPELPESPLYDILSPYLLPVSTGKGIEGKANIKVLLKTLHSFRHLYNPPILSSIKPAFRLFKGFSIEDPLGLRYQSIFAPILFADPPTSCIDFVPVERRKCSE